MGGPRHHLRIGLIFGAVLCVTTVVVTAQDTRPASAPVATLLDRWMRDLESPYQAERRAAVAAIVESRIDESILTARLDERPGRVRIGIAEALVALGTKTSVDVVARIATNDPDEAVRESFGRALFAIVCREGPRTADVLTPLSPTDPAMLDAAETYARREIERLVRVNTEWTYYRGLARFFWMGPYAEPALLRILGDKEAASAIHCLAATALGRVHCPTFWMTPTGAVTDVFKNTLKDAGEDARMALIYAAASAGAASPEFVAEVARYTREDAFNPLQIEAGLYHLAALTDAQIAASKDVVAACAREFTHGYDERVQWNGGVVLGRVNDPETAKARIADMKESRTFGGYALFDGIVTNLARLPAAEADPLIRDLCTWGLAQEVPQIRGLAYETWRKRFGAPPEGVDLKALVAEIVRSTKKNHGVDLDQDSYAQRTGITILAKLGASEFPELLRELLHFPSESVRAAAAMVAGASASAVTEDLVPMLAKEGEWDVFGAAYALQQIGDRRAIPAWIELLDCGNFALLWSVKTNLEQMTGKKLEGPAPVTQRDWHDLAIWWRRTFAADMRATNASQPTNESQPTNASAPANGIR